MLKTTKRQLREYGACEERYDILCTWAPKDDGAEISLLEILDRNGVEDAIWALRACDGNEEISRYLARWCAAQALHLWSAPDVVVRYLRTGNESIRDAAWAAAWAAAWDVVWAAAWAAAMAAARDAAMAAARDAQAAKLRELLVTGVPEYGIVEVTR